MAKYCQKLARSHVKRLYPLAPRPSALVIVNPHFHFSRSATETPHRYLQSRRNVSHRHPPFLSPVSHISKAPSTNVTYSSPRWKLYKYTVCWCSDSHIAPDCKDATFQSSCDSSHHGEWQPKAICNQPPCNQLNLPSLRTESMWINTFGSTEPQDVSCDVVEVGVLAKGDEPMRITALVVLSICNALTTQPINDPKQSYDYLIRLELADSAEIADVLEIDLLIMSQCACTEGIR